jgi:hypothetical protein
LLGLADVPYLTVQEKPRRAMLRGFLFCPRCQAGIAQQRTAKSILTFAFVTQTMFEIVANCTALTAQFGRK